MGLFLFTVQSVPLSITIQVQHLPARPVDFSFWHVLCSTTVLTALVAFDNRHVNYRFRGFSSNHFILVMFSQGRARKKTRHRTHFIRTARRQWWRPLFI